MNKNQFLLLLNWTIFLILIVFAIINHEWVNLNWSWLRWPVIVVIILIAVFGGKETTGWGKPGVKLREFVEEHRFLKLWIIIVTLSILIFLSYSFNNGINLDDYSGTLLLVGLGVLLLPLFIVSEYKRFKRLGNKSNK